MTPNHRQAPTLAAEPTADPNSLRTDMAKKALSFFLLLSASICGLLLALYTWLGHDLQAQVVLPLITALFLTYWILLRSFRNLEIISTLSLITTIGVLVWFLATNSLDGLGLFWVYFVPSYIFLLKGKEVGTRYVFVFLVLVFSTFALSIWGMLPGQLSPTVIVHSITSLLFISILAWVFSSLQHQYRVKLVQAYTTHQQFKMAVDNSSNHIVITNVNGIILYANPAAEKTTGYSRSEMTGQTPRLWGGLMSPELYQKLWHTIKVEKKPFVGEITNIDKSGQIYTALARISPILDEGKLAGFIGTEENISYRLELEKQLKAKVAELEKTNRLMINRELRMRELKEELSHLRGNSSDETDQQNVA